MLGVTCDNASANDKMVESMAEIMAHFSGEANQARCLAHIVNLVAKIILHQFDMSKKKKKKNLLKETDTVSDANKDQEHEDPDDLMSKRNESWTKKRRKWGRAMSKRT